MAHVAAMECGRWQSRRLYVTSASRYAYERMCVSMLRVYTHAYLRIPDNTIGVRFDNDGFGRQDRLLFCKYACMTPHVNACLRTIASQHIGLSMLAMLSVIG